MDRFDMLKIMKETGALDDLDINDEDFLDGHGRETRYVEVMEQAYALGLRARPGPCMQSAPGLWEGVPPVTCTLLAGHAGGHTNGVTSWASAEDADLEPVRPGDVAPMRCCESEPGQPHTGECTADLGNEVCPGCGLLDCDAEAYRRAQR